MIYWTLESSMVSGAILEYPELLKDTVKDYKFILILGQIPGYRNSLVTKVARHIINNNLQNPKITIDKSNFGSMMAGDKVIIKEFKPPVAKQILLALDTKYFLAEGNWGNKIVNSAVNGQILDIGQNIDFMYGDIKPMFVTGQIKATIPKAPALVDNQTNFIVEKLPRDILTKLKIEADKNSEKRAKEYFKQIEEENFDTISNIRNNTAEKIEKTFNFTQNDPKSIYKSVKQSLERLSHSFYIDQFENLGENFLGSILSIPITKKGVNPDYCIEFKLSGTMMQGTCLITGYSSKFELISKILDDLIKHLNKVSNSLKEAPQSIPDICQACGSRLNLTKQNEKGIVLCEICKSPNLLPYRLRM